MLRRILVVKVVLILLSACAVKPNTEMYSMAIKKMNFEVLEEQDEVGLDHSLVVMNNGNRPLHSIINKLKHSKDLGLFNHLIKYPSDINTKNNDGFTPLLLALKNDLEPTIIQSLVDAGADPFIENSEGNAFDYSYLHKSKSLPVIKKSLEKDKAVYDKVIKAIAENNSVEFDKLLKANRIYANYRESGGKSLLNKSLSLKHYDLATSLISYGAAINYADDTNNYPLLVCIQTESLDCVNLVLSSGADVNFSNESGYTALMHASRVGAMELVVKLVELGANLNAKDVNGYTALRLAIENHKNDVESYLIRQGANTNILYGMYGNKIPLIEAIKGSKDYEENKQHALFLIEYGANVNAEDKYGNTPLTEAMLFASDELTLKLLNSGADIELKTKHKETPVIGAIMKDRITILKELLRRGAKVVYKNEDYWNQPLFIAAQYGKTEALRLLLAQGYSPDLETGSGYSLLDQAIDSHHGKFETVKMLIDLGADVSSDKGGHNPLHYTVGYHSGFDYYHDKHKEAQLLIDAGCDINARTEKGFTPLMLAARNGSIKTVKVLLKNGAKVNEKNWSDLRRKAIHYALSNKHYEIAKLLDET